MGEGRRGREGITHKREKVARWKQMSILMRENYFNKCPPVYVLVCLSPEDWAENVGP